MKPKINMCMTLFVLALVGFVLVLFLGKNSSENYKKCICSETGDQRNCQDTEIVKLLYNDGILTESTNLGARGWSTVSPGDVNYPKSEGCAWPNKTTDRLWTAWDFTDF